MKTTVKLLAAALICAAWFADAKTTDTDREMVETSKFDRLLELRCDPAMGKVKASAVRVFGKDGAMKASISATAAKGFTFAGWYLDPGFTTPATFWKGSGSNAKPNDYRNASQSVVMTGPTRLFARFVGKSEAGDPIMHLRFLGAGYCGADASAETETWYQGVALPTNCAIAFGSASLPKVTVSGLPAGVRFDKANLRFTGVPTACSTDRKPFFTVKVSVKNKSGTSDVLKKDIVVEPLPSWAVGKFDGYHIEDGETNGTFTATVGKTGKVRGKTVGGWADTTFGAKSFANVFTFDGENLIYTVDVTVKYKVYSEKFEQTDTLYLMEDPETHIGTIGGGDAYGNGAVGIQRAWDRKDLDFPAFGTKAPENRLVLENGLTLKFGAKGKVTVGGTLYGVRASGATYVLPVAWRSTKTVDLLARVPVYIAPTLCTPEFCRVYEVLLNVGEDGKLVCVPINPPPPVQLWADGPFFAQCNLGATQPTDYGELYDFDDAGTEVAKLGDGWRLPTKAELETLLDKSKCKRKWIVRDGVNGYLFTNKSDPVKSIFLPAASCDFGNGRDYDYVGREGDYWSSDECDDDSAWSLDFFEEIISVDSVLRCNGMSVRAVR